MMSYSFYVFVDLGCVDLERTHQTNYNCVLTTIYNYTIPHSYKQIQHSLLAQLMEY